MGLCSPRGRELFLVRSLHWCSPRTAPSKVSQTDGFLMVFGTVFKLIFYFLNLLSRFLLNSVSKAWEPADVLTPPKVGKTRNSEDFAIWRTLASRQADCTHSANGIFHKRTELTVVHGGAVVHQSPCACMCSRILHGDHGSPRLAAQWPCSHFIFSFHFKTMLFWSFLLGYLKFWMFHHSFTVSDLHRLPQKSSCGSSYFHRTQLPASFWTSQIALRPSSLLDSFLFNSFHIWSILLASFVRAQWNCVCMLLVEQNFSRGLSHIVKVFLGQACDSKPLFKAIHSRLCTKCQEERIE